MKEEWGMRGFAVTDFSNTNNYMDVIQGVLAVFCGFMLGRTYRPGTFFSVPSSSVLGNSPSWAAGTIVVPRWVVRMA